MRVNKFTQEELFTIKVAVRDKKEAYETAYKRKHKEMSKQSKNYCIGQIICCEDILRKLEKVHK